jgi:enoyl-CoA hydratase
MNPQYLQVTREDGVLRVLINRPEKRNALSQTVLNEIREVFTAHASDQTLIAATITGAGERCFAAGGDLKEFDGLRDRAAVAKMTLDSSAALDAIRHFPVPVIGLLNGDAIGGGAELAVACDMRVFAAHAKMAFVQGTLCISPAWGGGADLIRLVGGSQALRLLSRADFLDAAAAERLGLADAIAEAGRSFEDWTQDFLKPIKARKPQVMRAFKAMVSASRTGDSAAQRAQETAALVDTWMHQDHWDAAEAVLARIAGAAK